MKKTIISTLAYATSLFASSLDKYPTLEIINSNTPIIDIRRVNEWQSTGILKDAITITFFDENNNYDMDTFLKELNQKIDTNKPFALICRTGRRTKALSTMLSQDFGYNAINLKGGMVYAKTKNLPIIQYKDN